MMKILLLTVLASCLVSTATGQFRIVGNVLTPPIRRVVFEACARAANRPADVFTSPPTALIQGTCVSLAALPAGMVPLCGGPTSLSFVDCLYTACFMWDTSPASKFLIQFSNPFINQCDVDRDQVTFTQGNPNVAPAQCCP